MITAIVLAAGRSTRMGQQKLLMPFCGGTMVSTVVGNIVAAGVDDVVVVTGSHAAEVRAALAHTSARFTQNPDVDRGMLSSVRCGIEAAPVADTYMIVLGDMPGVDCEANRIILAQHDGAITIPEYDGRRGHPVLIDAQYRQAILTRYDDVGLRGLMNEFADDVQTVPIDSDSVLIDLDTPEDYDRQRRG